MKVVINVCFGGFGLSVEGEKLYAKKCGFELFYYKQTKYKHNGGVDEYVRQSNPQDLFVHSLKIDMGILFSTWTELVNKNYFSSRDIERTDLKLIEVVEELGDLANGSCAKLKVVEIPNGIEWEIDEYDGNERIAETHRTWG